MPARWSPLLLATGLIAACTDEPASDPASVEAGAPDASEMPGESDDAGSVPVGDAADDAADGGNGEADARPPQTTDGAAADAMTDARTDAMVDANLCEASEACGWADPPRLSCGDGSACCEDRTCITGECLDLCGEGVESFTEPLGSDYGVLGTLCNFNPARVVLRSTDACDETVLYDWSTTYRQADGQLDVSISRATLRPQQARVSSESLMERTLPWASASAPSSPPANFAVNPGETRAVFWVTDTGSGSSELHEVDLATGDERTLSGTFPGKAYFLTDTLLLQCADGIGAGVGGSEEGLYAIDLSGDVLQETFVAGRFQCGGPLGKVGGTHILTGGTPIVGGTAVALAVIPISAIEEVVAGTRTAIDVFADAGIQRIERGEVWQHFVQVVGGAWLYAPSNQDYSAYQFEPLTLMGGQLQIGSPSPAPGVWGAFLVADDRFLLRLTRSWAIVEKR